MKITAAGGCYVYDEAGRRYLDLTSQGGLVGIGHGHPVLREALRAQVSKLIYVHHRYGYDDEISSEGRAFRISHELVHDAVMAVARRAIDATQVFFAVSGSAALMTGLKACRLSRTMTAAPPAERCELLEARRDFPQFAVLGFAGSYHGHMGEAQQLTDARASYRLASAPAVHVERLPFPHEGMTSDERAAYVVRARAILDELEAEFGWRVAAFVFEPILGSGDLPDPQTLLALCAEVRKRGIPLFADEFKTGQGRTGRDFACQHYGLRPDMMMFSKILTGGLPCSAIAATDAIVLEPLPPESYWDLGTFRGNPLAATSMQVVLDVVDREQLAANAAERGAQLAGALRARLADNPAVTAVDGTGLLLNIKLRDEDSRDRLCDAALERGLLTFAMGRGWGTPKIVVMPPLTITATQVDDAVDGLVAAAGAA